MDPKDADKLKSAIAGVDNLQAQLGNIAKRGPNAVKAWMAQVASTTDKDLESLYKEGSDAKKRAAYADVKAFRSKAVTKYLASSKQFELESLKITASLMNVIPKGGGMYPGMGDTNVKALVGYLENFNKYLNAFKVEINKI